MNRRNFSELIYWAASFLFWFSVLLNPYSKWFWGLIIAFSLAGISRLLLLPSTKKIKAELKKGKEIKT